MSRVLYGCNRGSAVTPVPQTEDLSAAAKEGNFDVQVCLVYASDFLSCAAVGACL